MLYNKQHGSSSSNVCADYRGSSAGYGSVGPSAAAAGAAVLAIDWQPGTFTLAAPLPAGELLTNLLHTTVLCSSYCWQQFEADWQQGTFTLAALPPAGEVLTCCLPHSLCSSHC
jgi:hypothetical protein